MELMCPHCHSNNHVGADGAAEAARFVCASCGTQFEAVPVEGALVTVLPRDGAAPFAPAHDPFDILSIPEEPEAAPAQAEVLEDVFVSAPSPHPAGAPAAPAEPSLLDEVDPLHITEAAPDRPAPAAAKPSPAPALMDSAEDLAPAAPHAKMKAPAPAAAPAFDKYAVGMRVLRVSPMWLLLSSLGFFAVLLMLSWMSRPVVPVEEAVASSPKLPNQATSPAPKSAPPAPAGEAKAAEKAPPPAPSTDAPKPAEALKPAPAPQPAAQSEAAPGGKYTVQVGSFSHSSEANQHVSKLRAAGFEARSVAVELPNRGTWYRVQTGRFGTRDEAAKAGAALRAKGLAAAAMVAEVN